MTSSNTSAQTYSQQPSTKRWFKNIVGSAFNKKRTTTEAQPTEAKTFATGNRLEEMAYLMKSIGPIYSTPFLLFYKGYDYHEIAAQLNLPVGTVKSRVFSARVKMKQLIAKRKAA